jgi:hypothetical protein
MVTAMVMLGRLLKEQERLVQNPRQVCRVFQTKKCRQSLKQVQHVRLEPVVAAAPLRGEHHKHGTPVLRVHGSRDPSHLFEVVDELRARGRRDFQLVGNLGNPDALPGFDVVQRHGRHDGHLRHFSVSGSRLLHHVPEPMEHLVELARRFRGLLCHLVRARRVRF